MSLLLHSKVEIFCTEIETKINRGSAKKSGDDEIGKKNFTIDIYDPF